MMKIDEWLVKAKQKIDALDAELIAVKTFGPKQTDRSWLVAHGQERVPRDKYLEAEYALRKRGEGVPLAYVLGEKEFYGRTFVVEEGVLVPRPETEALIDLVKGLPLPDRPRFMDVGTGSGCIAETLALEFPQSEVLATDINPRALAIAEENDFIHEGRVELVASNLLKDLEFETHVVHFDAIVANLPYVNKEWDWVDPENLKYEPATALYAKGNNGLAIYQRFLKELHHYAYSEQDMLGAWVDYLVLEADPCQHRSLIGMASRAGYEYVKTDGYGVLFEQRWRYWWDYEKGEYVHKPDDVLRRERLTGRISFSPDEAREF